MILKAFEIIIKDKSKLSWLNKSWQVYPVIDNSGNEIAKLISATELSSIMLEPDSMYIIKETGVSEEYLFDEHSITIETDSKGNIITEGYENGKIIITKMKKPVVNIEITDQYKKAVEGAEVVISDENGRRWFRLMKPCKSR